MHISKKKNGLSRWTIVFWETTETIAYKYNSENFIPVSNCMQHTNKIWTFAPQEVLRLAVIHGVPSTVLKNSQGHPVKEGQMRLSKESVPFVSK